MNIRVVLCVGWMMAVSGEVPSEAQVPTESPQPRTVTVSSQVATTQPLVQTAAVAEEPSATDVNPAVGEGVVEPAKSNFNIPLPTLGGKQFWTDYAWNDGWRLQQNAITSHWRLLSPGNTRYAWGSREACQQMMDRHCPQRLADERIIVLLHGLMRSSGSMSKIGDALSSAGIERPVKFEYASTRRGIAEHAAALRNWLEQLPGEPRLVFVAHSMGNIVVRHLIADLQRDGDPRGILSRCEKMAMLGPPNQGADIARQLGRLGLFEVVTGQGGMELGPAWEAFQEHLATPPFPFIIVAGDLSESWMKNPLVKGPSDLVVRLEEARLAGAAQLHTVPLLHSFLMNDPQVQQLVVDFLR